MIIIDWIKSFFSGLLKAFKSFINSALPIIKQIVIAKLKDVAIQVVTELSTADMSNDRKRQDAFTRIQNYAKSTGVEVKDSLINTILELALQTLKD